MKSGKKWRSRIFIVFTGVVLGYAARFILGAPEVENSLPKRKFDEPLRKTSISDLPILPIDEDFSFPIPINTP
jgi:hypothetical protein